MVTWCVQLVHGWVWCGVVWWHMVATTLYLEQGGACRARAQNLGAAVSRPSFVIDSTPPRRCRLHAAVARAQPDFTGRAPGAAHSRWALFGAGGGAWTPGPGTGSLSPAGVCKGPPGPIHLPVGDSLSSTVRCSAVLLRRRGPVLCNQSLPKGAAPGGKPCTSDAPGGCRLVLWVLKFLGLQAAALAGVRFYHASSAGLLTGRHAPLRCTVSPACLGQRTTMQ